MGTRYLVVVRLQQTVRLAQYGINGGIPREAGETVLAFAREHLSSPAGRERFASQLARVRLVNTDEARMLEKDLGLRDLLFTHAWHEQVEAAYPGLTASLGADVLELVLVAEGTFIAEDSTSFLDPVWFYIIDLDRETLEVTGGYHDHDTVHTWPLNALPTTTAFLAELRENDEDEEHSVN